MEDTHTHLERLVVKDNDTGDFHNLGEVLTKAVEFQKHTLDRFGRLETKIARLWDRVTLLLWVGGVLFTALVGYLATRK